MGASLLGHKKMFHESTETAVVDRERRPLTWLASSTAYRATSLDCSQGQCSVWDSETKPEMSKVQQNLTLVGLTPIGLARKLESRLAT